MSREAQQFDVLVIGGGPAGVAAAVGAAQSGASVGIIDDNLILGGQIWRGQTGKDAEGEAARWFDLLQSTGVVSLCGLRVFHQPEPGVLWAEGIKDIRVFRYKKLVLATGARERFLPFPGWTLPNVMGAGGLQAMVKSGLPIRGKRVVVAGTGPLLLAVAAFLRQHGADIAMICEQAALSSLAWFSATLLMQPAKIIQALELKRALGGTSFAASSWIITAQGTKKLETVTISRGGTSETIACDYLACGFHLVPNTELAQLLGCQISKGCVQVDNFQRTTIDVVFCAGEPTGIGGVELSLIEGQIAGLASSGHTTEARNLFGRRARARRFARILAHAFALRPELKSLPTPETLICRCEDVTCSRLKDHSSWRAAKLHTRCGMGPCQARICGPATQFLFDWNPDSVRPPILPVRLESLTEAVSCAQEQSGAAKGDTQ